MKPKQQPSSQVALPSQEDTNQKRTLPMFLQSSDFDRIEQENQFCKMASNPCGGRYTGGKEG